MTRIHASYSAGSVLGLTLTPLLVTQIGWPAALQAFSAAGLAWVVRCLFLDSGQMCYNGPVWTRDS